MKHRLSVTVEEDILLKIRDRLRDKSFRSKSHTVEYDLFKLLNGEKDGK